MYTAVMLILFIGLVVVFIWVFRNNSQRGNHDKVFRPDAERLQTEFENTVEEAISRLEERISKLEGLLIEADRTINILENKNADSEVKNTSLRITSNAQTALSAYQQQKVDKHNDFNSFSDELNKAVRYSDITFNKENEIKSTDNDNSQLVLALYNEGYAINEIARATGLGQGEVRLLLQLHKHDFTINADNR